VCRIEPENNVHLILEAFSKIPHRKLVFVGNWNNSEYGKELKEKYRSYANLLIFDPIYHQRTLDLLRSNCSIYIHGHSAGGTNPSLVEAMYLKLPVIAFNVSYNVATTNNMALYFKRAEDLEQLLSQVTTAQLEEVKNNMKRIADERYTWKIVANKYAYLIYAFGYNYAKKPVRNSLSTVKEKVLLQSGFSHMKNNRQFFE
jgi:glycosyltransferase involved in cell wall biosynthesis